MGRNIGDVCGVRSGNGPDSAYCSLEPGHSGDEHKAYYYHDREDESQFIESWPKAHASPAVAASGPARVEALAKHLARPDQFWHGVAKAVADTALRWAAENPEAPKDRPSENAWRELAAALGAGDHPAALAEIRRLQAVEKRANLVPLRRLILEYREAREAFKKAIPGTDACDARQSRRTTRLALFAAVKE